MSIWQNHIQLCFDEQSVQWRISLKGSPDMSDIIKAAVTACNE